MSLAVGLFFVMVFGVVDLGPANNDVSEEYRKRMSAVGSLVKFVAAPVTVLFVWFSVTTDVLLERVYGASDTFRYQ